MWKEDSAIANLFYEMPINEKTSEITPEVIKTPNRIGVSLEKLKEDSKSQIGAVHLKAVSKASGQTYETDAEAGEKLIVLKKPSRESEIRGRSVCMAERPGGKKQYFKNRRLN